MGKQGPGILHSILMQRAQSSSKAELRVNRIGSRLKGSRLSVGAKIGTGRPSMRRFLTWSSAKAM